MFTVEDLKAEHMYPTDMCWIIWEGHKVCRFSRWVGVGRRSYTYVFSPDWEEWKKAGRPHIAGLPMDEIVLSDYVFYEYMPAFYYLRYIPEQRADWDDYARAKGLETGGERDSWKLMLAYKGRAHEDRFLVEECEIDYEFFGLQEPNGF